MNLLKETLEILKDNDKKENDILWCGNLKLWFSYEEFKKLADTNYDGGFGAQKVAKDLLLVGKDFWLERHEYDGSEWWEYKEIPQKPSPNLTIKALTVNQSNDLFDENRCGWESLFELNNIEEIK